MHHSLENLPRTLVSVHDLMPETMPAVKTLLGLLERWRIAPVTLLVVPGRDWRRANLDDLRALERHGYRLAAHGWRHDTTARRPYHRLHAALLSRRVAEHLDLDANGIVALLRRSHAWFGDQCLAPPTLYVPPAWAMGRIARARLIAEAPFERYEYFGGVFDLGLMRYMPVPLLGYEADRATRGPLLRFWNGLNRIMARRRRLLRIGIHPFDDRLRLAADLRADLRGYSRHIDYAEIGAE